MNEARLATISVLAYQLFQSIVPRDTGNMQNNATIFTALGNNTYSISVSGQIAPYAVYTNEPWLSAKWNGKKNPNQGWIDKGVEFIVAQIAASVGGTYRRI